MLGHLGSESASITLLSQRREEKHQSKIRERYQTCLLKQTDGKGKLLVNTCFPAKQLGEIEGI